MFGLTKNIDQGLKLRRSFTITSVFKFYIRFGKIQKVEFFKCFLDLKRPSNGLMTSVYIKPTYDSQTLNYLSIKPLKYKASTVETLMHRWIENLENQVIKNCIFATE